MKNNLILFLVMAFVLALTSVARADDACARADYLAAEVQDGIELIEELIEMAKPVCRERALSRDCARQRIEIRARLAEVIQLQKLQIKAAQQCKSGTATGKASAP